ncbi:PepSY domain-containing protein [Alkalihalobacterium elongatum]|uniref:PepSY domain-containing protein n=1 Tax=Alkalihalobacterium elongatum TaxID=2675466 RepID=UPI001F3EDEA3|nr:PepSY domain-containing protein [Alkalihalobacterium elongatum]
MFSNSYNWSYYPPYYQTMGHGRITVIEAIQIALNKVPGQVVEVELEIENGFLVYEIEIITPLGFKYEVEVDVYTGKILKVELD